MQVSDIHAIHQRMVAAGVAFNSEPLAGDGALATYGHDPDGNVVELIEMLTGESLKYSLDSLPSSL